MKKIIALDKILDDKTSGSTEILCKLKVSNIYFEEVNKKLITKIITN
ncbi:MAG: hypothetical protein ACYCVH_13820 [Ignavibacteriaceae bacterium]